MFLSCSTLFWKEWIFYNNLPIIIGEKFPQNVKDCGRVRQLEGIYFVSCIDLGKSFPKSSRKGYQWFHKILPLQFCSNHRPSLSSAWPSSAHFVPSISYTLFQIISHFYNWHSPTTTTTPSTNSKLNDGVKIEQYSENKSY